MHKAVDTSLISALSLQLSIWKRNRPAFPALLYSRGAGSELNQIHQQSLCPELGSNMQTCFVSAQLLRLLHST